MTDGSPDQDGSSGAMSWVNVQSGMPLISWNKGLITGKGIPFVWNEFEVLASSAVASSGGGFTVIKVDQGGVYSAAGAGYRSYSQNDFIPSGQGVIQGAACVVFSGAGTIRLTKAPDGSQFGPSILAPYAHVIVDGDVGFVDGFIIAKSYSSSGGNAGSVELHGNGYRGPFECDKMVTNSPSTASPTTAAPTTASPTSGCMYEKAVNFSPGATEDDGSCTFSKECTDDACNVSSIVLSLNSGWNWISYVPMMPLPLGDAIDIGTSGFQVGDTIKSKDQNAVAVSTVVDGKKVEYWSGTLGLDTSTLRPGVGYFAQVSSSFTFDYNSELTGQCPSTSTSEITTTRARRSLTSGVSCPTPVNTYEHTAVVTAMVYDVNGIEMTGGAALVALDESCQVRAVAGLTTQRVAPGLEDRYFELNIGFNRDELQHITYRLVKDGRVLGISRTDHLRAGRALGSGFSPASFHVTSTVEKSCEDVAQLLSRCAPVQPPVS